MFGELSKIEIKQPVTERDVTEALEDFRLTMRDLATGQNVADYVFSVYEAFAKNSNKKLPADQVNAFEERFNKILADIRNLSRAADELKRDWDQAQAQNDNDEVAIDEQLKGGV